jgi:hypothetical protein
MTNGPLQGQIAIPGQVVFSKIGIEGIPVYNIENACASGSSAFNLAVQSLKAGTTDVALALGAEKMNIPDKMKAFAIFEGGWDVSRAEENYETLVKMGEGVETPPGSESDKPLQQVHGDLRGDVPPSHEDVWNDPTADRGGVGEESRPLGAQPVCAISQDIHDRGSPRRAADHLSRSRYRCARRFPTVPPRRFSARKRD